MTFDEILLALIAQRPRSGYDLRKWLSVEGVFIRANADQSQIYRTLRRLAKAGLIDHEVVRRGGPDAKVFRLTVLGRDELIKIAELPYEPPARWQEADFQARFSLLGPIVPHTVLDLIDTEIAFRRKQIALYRDREIDEAEGSEFFALDRAWVETIRASGHRYGIESMDRWLEYLSALRTEWIRTGHADPTASSSAST